MFIMSLLCIALLIPVISAVRPTTDLSDTEAPQLEGPGGKELMLRLKEAFQGNEAFQGEIKSPVAREQANFIFLDKDGTQTPPADFQDEDFKEAWTLENSECQKKLKSNKDIQVVTATGQPFFMWSITVGTAPYAVLSGGNAWVVNSEQVGQVTIVPDNLELLKRVDEAMRGVTKFYYMNRDGMYSLAEKKEVDDEFFGYIGKNEKATHQLKEKLNNKVKYEEIKDNIEILYVKHCGKNKFDIPLINVFLGHLGTHFETPIEELQQGNDPNGRVWELPGKGQNLKVMIMMTSSFCEIAISAGDKSTGMSKLLNIVGGAKVLMGAGDSGNDVALQKLVTGNGGYFVASPGADQLKSFSAADTGAQKPPPLQYNDVFTDKDKPSSTVPGLWFQLPQAWGLC